jgi:hypothetical protein
VYSWSFWLCCLPASCGWCSWWMSWCVTWSIGVVKGLVLMGFSHDGCGPHSCAVRMWCPNHILLLKRCFWDFFVVSKIFWLGLSVCLTVLWTGIMQWLQICGWWCVRDVVNCQHRVPWLGGCKSHKSWVPAQFKWKAGLEVKIVFVQPSFMGSICCFYQQSRFVLVFMLCIHPFLSGFVFGFS